MAVASLAELSHDDPAQGKRGRIVPKRDQLEGTQGGAWLECSRCRRDERIHVASYAVIGRHQKVKLIPSIGDLLRRSRVGVAVSDNLGLQ